MFDPLCNPLLLLHLALQAVGTAKQPVRSLTKVGEDVFGDAVETASAAASVASDLGQSKPASYLPAQLSVLPLFFAWRLATCYLPCAWSSISLTSLCQILPAEQAAGTVSCTEAVMWTHFDTCTSVGLQ